LYEIVAKLRSPAGCHWDREQTPQTLRGYLIEETFECVEAVDENNPAHIKEELGDLFLVALMLSYVYQEDGLFSVNDALAGVSEKLIRRHPHVFGDKKAKDSAEVLENWAKIKAEEQGRKAKGSMLYKVSKGTPPLERAYKLQKKAQSVGFDWARMEDIAAKIEEEIKEAKSAAAALQALGNAQNQELLEEELGDILFSAVNLCRFLNVDPSLALQRTNNKFVKRFKYMEQKMHETSQEMRQENIMAMEGFWEEAKKA
jgi:tetrapyrrole methylase family protein/MazG family protein